MRYFIFSLLLYWASFLNVSFAKIDVDLLQLLKEHPLVEYGDDFYVRVFSKNRYDGTSYTVTKVAQVLIDRFCPKPLVKNSEVRLKTKIKGLHAIDYSAFRDGSFTTFRFPFQKVECIQSYSSQKTDNSNEGLKKTEELDHKPLQEITSKRKQIKVADKELKQETKEVTKKYVPNLTAQERNTEEKRMNEVLGSEVIVEDRVRLLDSYIGVTAVKFSDEY